MYNKKGETAAIAANDVRCVCEGDELPEDFICPLCKHGAADFAPIG